jgi:broad specificity phosphatase PhoE
MDTLILSRHAESVFNERGVLNGDPSVAGGLTERGTEQARALGRSLAGESIDLCVTTAFERTRATADIAFADRTIRRLIMSELDDPPNGDFELRPASELAEWREGHGPDVPIPGTGRSEREHVRSMLPGLELLLSRRERTVVAILHGWFVGWIVTAATRGGPAPGYATAVRIPRTVLDRAVIEMRRDPYRWLSA